MNENETVGEEVKSVNQENADTFYKPEAEKNEETKPQDDKQESTSLSSEDSSKESEVADDNEEKKSESNESETDKAEESKEEVEYKLSLKEDSYIDQEYLQEVENFAKENKLSNESAQSLINSQESALAKIVQKAEDLEDAQIEDWKQEVISDPIMGGDNLAKTSENAKRVVEKFGSPELIDMLNETGYGNNPHVVKLLASIGEQMGEDSLIFTNTQGSNNMTPEEKFYS